MIEYIYLGIIINGIAFIIDLILTGYLVFSISYNDKIKTLDYINDLKEKHVIHPYFQMFIFLIIPFYGTYLTVIHLFFIINKFNYDFISLIEVEESLNKFKIIR